MAGGEAARVLVLELWDRVAGHEARLEALERAAGANSQNSSLPPSSDSPKTRAERRRAARDQAKRSMLRAGGQPGHEGKARELVGGDRVDVAVAHLPLSCACGHDFTGEEERLGAPVISQKWELPVIVPIVSEHHQHRLACPACGKGTLAELGAGVSVSGYGPRLEAHIGMLAGVYRLSRRQITDIVTQMLGVPASVGAINETIMRMSAVLADPWTQLREAVQRAEVVHADETSWRLAGEQQWLWLAASALYACFRIDPSRSQKAAKALLGEDFGGMVISDRYAGYHFLDVLQQQLCWAHVIRQFVQISERDGAPGLLGQQLVTAARQVIATHHDYLGGDHDLAWLENELIALRAHIQTLLETGAAAEHPKTARFCTGLLSEYQALWAFCETEGISPTNNEAERAVRHAVILRKIQIGTQSECGSRWIERIASVFETCKLQGRSTLEYLISAATAHHHQTPIPRLTPI